MAKGKARGGRTQAETQDPLHPLKPQENSDNLRRDGGKEMRIYTEKRILVRLVNMPFAAQTFDMLVRLSVIAPNLRLEAVEVATDRPLPVRLCALDWDWRAVNMINLPNS